MNHAKSASLSVPTFILLLSLIFIRPFLSDLAYPTLEIYYENFLIALAIITIFINRKPFSRNPYSVPILLILFAYLTSSMQSVNIQNSIRETIKFISYLCMFFLVTQIGEKQKKALLKTIVICASIISIYSIYQYFWGYQHTLSYLKKTQSDFLLTSSYAGDILIAKRAIGTFPSPNILGSYLILAFFLALYLLFERARRSRTSRELFFLITIIFAIILTKSIGAWLSLILALTILFILSYKSLKKRKLLLAFSFILIILTLFFILISRWERLMNLENPQNSIIQRLNYWRTAIAIIKDHPILGVGPGNFKDVYFKYKVGQETSTIYAHNIFLQMWAETGILGLIGIVFLLVSFITKPISKSKYLFLSGLTFILCNLIDNTYFIPQAGMFWWILLGLL